MKLTTQTDYALRTLMYLGTHQGRVKVSDVSAIFDISNNHIAKVVNLLANGGYIESIRGVGGGIELAMDPADIIVGEVVEYVEGNLHLLDCIDTKDVCVIQSFCKLRRVLREAERVQVEYLYTVTLDDILPTRRQLNRIS